MFPFRKIFILLMALVVLAGSVGFSVQPVVAAPQAATCAAYHTVRPGENLYRIGQAYGVRWQDLWRINNLKNPRVIYAGQVLCIPGAVIPITGLPAGTIPTFTITAVERNKTVSIETRNFPANDTFDVLMGRYGTLGVGGIKIGTINSGAGGTFSATFNIPADLFDRTRIAIRLQSPISGYYSYNWFYNNSTTGGGTGGNQPPVDPGYTGIPTFMIQAVVRDQTVTIAANNFPPNLDFDVLMNYIGTRGVGGIKVASFNSGQGGSFTRTFNIPAELYGQRQIAIRTQNLATGYFSYNWFYNNTYP